MRQTGILSVIFLFLAILSACGDKTQSGYEAPEVSESSDQEEASGSEPAEESEEESDDGLYGSFLQVHQDSSSLAQVDDRMADVQEMVT